MAVAILTIHLQLPLCGSLKEKRSRIKPILARLHREFNLSTAEMDLQDRWHEAILGCAIIVNDRGYAQSVCQQVLHFFEHTWPDLPILENHIEII